MKSKSKLLQEAYENKFAVQKYERSVLFNTYEHVCLDAMAAHSEQIAIGFAEWMNDEDCQNAPEGWVMKRTNYEKHYTIHELFNLYKQSNK